MVIIYVGGLTKDITEKDLQEFFGRRVQIKGIAINRKHIEVFSKIKNVPAFAFLDCTCDEDQLAKVLAYNRCYWNGAYLRVQVAKKGPYTYKSKTPEEKHQSDSYELPNTHEAPTEPYSVYSSSLSKKDSVEACTQPVDVNTHNFVQNTKQTYPRRKRVRVLNTLISSSS